jgi:hypothetical protein
MFTHQYTPWSLQDFRIFWCPTYVLDKDVLDGKSISKWRAWSWRGIYIGTSNCHSSNILLIYSPSSTHISPQFHVIFDETFHTVMGVTNTINLWIRSVLDLYMDWSRVAPAVQVGSLQGLEEGGPGGFWLDLYRDWSA